tara:strand:- start:781 stop:1005 length:225 start_codon:yes stop_codon:yes gene_type:complete
MIKINSNYNPDIHEHKYRYALCETVSGNLKLVELDKAWEKEDYIEMEFYCFTEQELKDQVSEHKAMLKTLHENY